ncbi:MAG: DUF2147 domain-containing protein [bacterium]|nr:DUF2147 domain-containing protein [bacterium]
MHLCTKKEKLNMKGSYLLPLILIAAFFLGSTRGDAGVSPLGTWEIHKKNTGTVQYIVEVYETGGTISARVLEIAGKNAESLCVKCRKERKNEPIKGMDIVWGMRKSGDVYEGGHLLNPANGKIFSCKMWVEGNRLAVRTYATFVFKTEYWYKKTGN